MNKQNVHYLYTVDENKVIDYVIDTYLWVSEYLNSSEIGLLGRHLSNLADRKATDVELTYIRNREVLGSCIPDDIPSDLYEQDI